MTLIIYKSIAALVIFLTSITIVIYPIKKRGTPKHGESAELGEALASGIFLGAAFFHMLPDALKGFGSLYPQHAFPFAETICIAGFLLLLFLERLSLTFSSIKSKQTLPYILLLILIVHAITEGAALGIGETLSETVMLFIAIAAHKTSETFALCTTLLRHELPFKRVIGTIIFFACMTPIGIALGASVDQLVVGREGELIAASFNAFAAGTFLYISTLHHVHFHQHGKDSRGMLEFASLVVGVVTMGIISFWT